MASKYRTQEPLTVKEAKAALLAEGLVVSNIEARALRAELARVTVWKANAAIQLEYRGTSSQFQEIWKQGRVRKLRRVIVKALGLRRLRWWKSW